MTEIRYKDGMELAQSFHNELENLSWYSAFLVLLHVDKPFNDNGSLYFYRIINKHP